MKRLFAFAIAVTALCVRGLAIPVMISAGISGQLGPINASSASGCGCGCVNGCGGVGCGCGSEEPAEPPLDQAVTLNLELSQTTFSVTPVGTTAFSISGQNNPTLTLARGATYTFTVNAMFHPFWIKTTQVAGSGFAFNTGVTNNGIESGTLTFTVPESAPNTLFYNCGNHSPMTGIINIVSVPEPGTLALFGSGLLVGLRHRRRVR